MTVADWWRHHLHRHNHNTQPQQHGRTDDMESPRKRSRGKKGGSSRPSSRGGGGTIVSATDEQARSLVRERDATIAALEQEVAALKAGIARLDDERAAAAALVPRRGRKGLTPYGNAVRVSVSKCTSRRRQLRAERARMGRNASMSTRAVLDALPDDGRSAKEAVVDRIQDMFRSPNEHVDYLKSERFAKDLLKLNKKVRGVLEDEPRCVFLQSPAYVFGDIHGNLEDLHFFSDNVWNLGMALTAGNFVFLGDYVDRGTSCLEVVAYLLAMKLTLPRKVFLLRGNHETRDVNGWEEHYGARSFIHQCRQRFGDDLGYEVWEATNATFDRMPLAAVIDQDIFCVHGGIPRPVGDMNVKGGRIRDILEVHKVAGINPPYEHEDDNHQRVASDCIWSDPASEDQEGSTVDRATGYGDSLRGGGAICFGRKAVTDFLSQQGFSYILRAHEAHAEGVAVSKGARVFTVFSTSKDHGQGDDAMAGCILVDFDKMQVINRSPAYRNQYVHRRDSVSLAMLSEDEIRERIELGLIDAPSEEEEGEEGKGGYEEEVWEEFDEDDAETSREDPGGSSADEDEGYVFDERRKSSVDPGQTTASPPGSSHDNHEFDVESSGVPSRKIDFSGVDSGRRKKRNKGKFATITEEDEEEGEDEESTVNGDDVEGFDESENNRPSATTTMSPAMKKISL